MKVFSVGLRVGPRRLFVQFEDHSAMGALRSYIDIADLAVPVRWEKEFGREGPLEVEIGFGTGEYITDLAGRDSGSNFLGFEQSPDRIVKTIRKIEQAGLCNVKVLKIDAALAFRYLLSKSEVQKVHCLFPCPWPKKRHAKHRLLSRDFLALVNSRLAGPGQMRIVTDHHPYADWIAEESAGAGFSLERRSIPPTFGTKFERKWSAAGQQAFDEIVLTKAADIHLSDQEVGEMKTYFLDKIDPARVGFGLLAGPVSVQFKDFIFDAGRSRGMVQAVVTENGQTQYVWIMIRRTANNWCLSAAPGSSVLPTAGVLKALEMARDAFRDSSANT